MAMETLNVIQFMQLFIGYIVFTVGLPALVFYRKAKRFPAAVRFLIYFTIGNFYVINLLMGVLVYFMMVKNHKMVHMMTLHYIN